MKNYQIAIKELHLNLGEGIKNKKVLLMSDNLAVVQIINKQSFKQKNPYEGVPSGTSNL